MSADNHQKPRRDPTTAFRSVADEGCLVVVPSRAAVEVLNPVAGKIYSMLDGTNTEDEIVRAVVDEFEIGEGEARKDYHAFLDVLRAKNMLASAPSNGNGAEEPVHE